MSTQPREREIEPTAAPIDAVDRETGPATEAGQAAPAHAGALRLEEVQPADWTPEFLSDWQELLETTPDSSVFLSPAWVTAWWRHFGDGHESRVLAARDPSGRLCGIAPLYLRKRRLAAGYARILALIGDDGVGSEYLGFLCRPDQAREFLGKVGEYRRADWNLVELRGLPERSPLAQAIPGGFDRGAGLRSYRERHPCGAIPLPGDHDRYLKSLSQKFRAVVRNRTNKLTKTCQTRMLRTERVDDLEPHLDRFFAMHQARWESIGAPGSFYGASKRAFYRDVSLDFLRRGWLRFYHLEVDGVIRASQFGFAFGGVLHSLQEAFDHDYHPTGVGGTGVVLRNLAIRDCIAEGLTTYDFLGGLEEFKTRWGTETHYVTDVYLGAPGLSGGVAFAAVAGGRHARVWLRDHVPESVVRGHKRLKSRVRTLLTRSTQQTTTEADQ